MTTTMATAMKLKNNRETPCIPGANALDHSIITLEIIDVASNKLSTATPRKRQTQTKNRIDIGSYHVAGYV